MRALEFFKHLSKQNLTHLERRATVSRQALHEALKTHNMKLQNLEAVAHALDYEVRFVSRSTEENVLASLKRFSAPVAVTEGGNLSLEDAVAAGVSRAHKDGLYESVVPYVLAVNAPHLRWKLLFAAAVQNNDVNELGYFTEMAMQFRPHPNLARLASALQSLKEETVKTLVKTEKVKFPELFQKNPFALKWNLLVRGTADEHFDRWEKWRKSRANS